MQHTLFKPWGRLCAILLTAAMARQSASAAPGAPAAPQPDVNKTAKQLEEVMKLLRQEAKDGGAAAGAGQGAAAPAKTPTPAAKPK